jgi:outer membrane murein-binding lipoprotein Lpp
MHTLGADGAGSVGRRLLLASLLGAALVAGCASPLTREELASRLEEAAASAPDPRAAHQIFAVHAPTRVAAYALLSEAKSDPRSPLSFQLGRRLATASGRRGSVVVGGPYTDLCDQVVRNALSMNRARGLRGLTVIFVAPEPPSEELRVAASASRAKLQHRPLR